MDFCFSPRRIRLTERNGDGMGKKKKKTEQKVIVYRSGVLNHADADRFEKACEAYLTKISKSKKAAREALVRLGTHTPDGQLTERFR